jgi:hypothetical protein
LNLSTVTVIGTGTLGGHLCKHLAECSKVSKLILIDKDIVDRKDTEVGIFHPIDIDEPKVHVLYRNLLNYNIEIQPRAEFYIEGITDLPESDLIIDCRNIFGKRDLNIDMKMFINGKFLILDFQKKLEDQTRPKGEYIIQLSKHEISRAASYATDLICSNVIEELLKGQSIKYIDIDIIQSVMLKSIKESKSYPDLIYDMDDDVNRISKLEEVIKPILNRNKKAPLKVAVQERGSIAREVFEIPKVAKTTYQIIPQNSLKQPEDVIEVLKNAIKNKSKSLIFLPVLIVNEIHILQTEGGA